MFHENSGLLQSWCSLRSGQSFFSFCSFQVRTFEREPGVETKVLPPKVNCLCNHKITLMHITAQCAHHILGVKCTVVKILQLCSESIPSPDRAGSRTRRVREKHTLREHRESRLSSRLDQAPLLFQTIQDRRSLPDSLMNFAVPFLCTQRHRLRKAETAAGMESRNP